MLHDSQKSLAEACRDSLDIMLSPSPNCKLVAFYEKGKLSIKTLNNKVIFKTGLPGTKTALQIDWDPWSASPRLAVVVPDAVWIVTTEQKQKICTNGMRCLCYWLNTKSSSILAVTSAIPNVTMLWSASGLLRTFIQVRTKLTAVPSLNCYVLLWHMRGTSRGDLLTWTRGHGNEISLPLPTLNAYCIAVHPSTTLVAVQDSFKLHLVTPHSILATTDTMAEKIAWTDEPNVQLLALTSSSVAIYDELLMYQGSISLAYSGSVWIPVKGGYKLVKSCCKLDRGDKSNEKLHNDMVVQGQYIATYNLQTGLVLVWDLTTKGTVVAFEHRFPLKSVNWQENTLVMTAAAEALAGFWIIGEPQPELMNFSLSAPITSVIIKEGNVFAFTRADIHSKLLLDAAHPQQEGSPLYPEYDQLVEDEQLHNLCDTSFFKNQTHPTCSNVEDTFAYRKIC